MLRSDFRLLAAAGVLWTGMAWGACVNPWVTSDAKVFSESAMPSTFSMEAFHESPAFKGLAPKEFCHKLFDLYYDGRRKSWEDFQRGLTLWAHTPQEPRAGANVIELDPVVLLNVHGTGYCGIQSGLLEGIYQSRPGGAPGKPAIEARRWFLDGIIHSVCDAYYDGKWHYFDVDLGGWAGDAEKDVWSVADVIADPKGYYGAKTALKAAYFFGADQKGAWVEKIGKQKSYCFQDNQMLGHEMTFALRKGERLTRYFSLEAAGWSETVPFTKKIDEKQKGYAELVWEPGEKDQAAESLGAKDGVLVFPIRLPYTLTSSKVECSGRASVSYDLGRSWTPLESDGTVKDAPGRWDYLLKIEGGSLRKATARGLLHPGALPRVGVGPTQMSVAQAAPYQTLTYLPDWSDAEKFNASTRTEGLAYKPSAKVTFTGGEAAGQGALVVPVKAPPGTRIVKLGACVIGGTGYPPDAKKFLELYLGPAGKTVLAGRSTDCSPWGAQPSTRVEHWQNNVNGAAACEPCAEAEAKVVVNGGGSVQGIRLYVHYVPAAPPAPGGTLTVTHGYDGRSVPHEISAADLQKGPVTYAVPGGAKKNEFVRLEVK